jgi:hypothetical protein
MTDDYKPENESPKPQPHVESSKPAVLADRPAHAAPDHTAEHRAAEARHTDDEAKDRAKANRKVKTSPQDALTFAIYDLQRGINKLRQSSAPPTPGTLIYDAIAYFEAAAQRLDRSLEITRGGKKLSAEEREKERERYQKEYVDPVTPTVAAPPLEPLT